MEKLPRPASSGRAWSSFVAESPPNVAGRAPRILHERGSPKHRLRVEHDPSTLLIHLADEDGSSWLTVAVDRSTRRLAVGRGVRQVDAAEQAYDGLYDG